MVAPMACGTYPIRLRTPTGSRSRSAPATVAVPAVGWSRVVSIRSVVVLPAPFGPRKPTISPSLTVRSTPRTASTVRLRLLNVRARPFASMIGMVVPSVSLVPRGVLTLSSNISIQFKSFWRRRPAFRGRFSRQLGVFSRQLGVEFVVPAHLGLEVQHAAPHDRGRERADVALGQQTFPLGRELGGGDR